jgi:hypothetical protein
MLGELIGSTNKERVLVHPVARDAGYACEIARLFDVPLDPLQKALDGLERAGVLVSRVVGSTREYRMNPRYVLRDELRALVQRALSLYPERLREELLTVRTPPRRKVKPL